MNKYLIINPVNPNDGNGINSYYQNVIIFIKNYFDVDVFSNENLLGIDDFRREVKAYVDRNYNKNDVIIEAPETRSSTLLLDRSYNVHIRLHTPLAICEKYENRPINQQRFSDELRVISQAHAVSAPSRAIVKELSNYISTDKIIISSNPMSKKISCIDFEQRKFDVIFIGRNHFLKGSHFLDDIVSKLPQNYRICFLGHGLSNITLSEFNRNRVILLDSINSDDRFNILSNAKVAIVPSLFENCSMTILESIAAGVSVVSWDVGGNGEFSSKVVKVVEFGNVDRFSNEIINFVESKQRVNNYSTSIIAKINQEYLKGFDSVRSVFD